MDGAQKNRKCFVTTHSGQNTYMWYIIQTELRDRYRKERVRYRKNLFADLIERETDATLSNPKNLIRCETGIVLAKTDENI